MTLLFAALLSLQLGGLVLGQPAYSQWYGPSVNLGRDWNKIPTDYVHISEENLDQFRPLNDWTIQIKTMDGVRVDNTFDFDHGDIDDHKSNKKEDDMSISYFSQGAPILNVLWNRKGITENSEDVTSLFCLHDYADYRSGSNVCSGGSNQTEQVWSFDLTKGDEGTRIQLSCYGTVEYERFQPYRMCPFVGLKVDQIHLRHLKNYLIRITPKDGVSTEEPTTFPPTSTEPAITEPPTTCDCWTAECSYCEDAKCRVKYDVTGAGSEGISITSKLTYRFVNTVHLFGPDGDLLGSLHVSKKAIRLVGCVRCRPKRFPASTLGGQIYDWNVSLQDSTLTVTVNGKEIFRHELIGECAEHYANIKEFAFSDVGCDGQFTVEDEMFPGSHFTDTDTCGTECLELL